MIAARRGGVAGGAPPAPRNCSLGTLRIAGWLDPLGEVEAANDNASRVDAYGYQEPGWLTDEDTDLYGGNFAETDYVYEVAGNRTSSTRNGVSVVNVYAYGNKLTSVGGTAVSWDGYGGVSADHRGYLFDRYPNGEEWSIEAPDTTELVEIERDVEGRPSVVDDNASGFTRQVWDNPGGEWPLAGVDDGGSPLIRGHRLAVEHVLGMLAAGDDLATILEGYPWLEREDVLACVEHSPPPNISPNRASAPSANPAGPRSAEGCT